MGILTVHFIDECITGSEESVTVRLRTFQSASWTLLPAKVFVTGYQVASAGSASADGLMLLAYPRACTCRESDAAASCIATPQLLTITEDVPEGKFTQSEKQRLSNIPS